MLCLFQFPETKAIWIFFCNSGHHFNSFFSSTVKEVRTFYAYRKKINFKVIFLFLRYQGGITENKVDATICIAIMKKKLKLKDYWAEF